MVMAAVVWFAACPGDDDGPTVGGGLDGGPDAPLSLDAQDAPGADAADVPVGGDDGPTDGPACPTGLKPYYKDPGCGAEAVFVCAMNDDGCFGPEICLCDGRTSRMCSWSPAPYRHIGACSDGGTGSD